MKINEIKYGFRLKSIKSIEDYNSVLYEFEHIKSGGLVAFMENDDTNCSFAIGFRTIPENSTGVCHIIEHSLLCGSDKYPLKEPFVNLIKGSMATFLNAFTAADWTMYPFASQTPKDFDNLLSVYMDAVFNPLSVKDPKPFLQEGWHLEMMNKDAIPQYKGVVYNEMKGAMSSVGRILSDATSRAMYKDTFYSYNSGGDPEVIPSLTWEDYKSFYFKHYTPQNAMTMFYGKMDIEPKLKFIDENYFSKFDKKEEEIIIYPQKPFINEDFELDYEISPTEDETDNTYMSLSYSLADYNNHEKLIAWQILVDALFSKNDSPAKKALLDAKLGQDIDVSIDDSKIISSLNVYLCKTNHNKKSEFKKVFLKTIKDLVDNGIEKEILIASINNFEFKNKEMNVNRLPKGILFAMTMMGSFNYRGNLEDHLQFTKTFEKLRNEIDNRYFENLLEEYILNSNHYVEVVINPDKTLGEKKKQKMDSLMKSIKENMSEKEIENCVNQTKSLIEYQNHIDTKEELDTLPKLSIKDIPITVNYLDSKKISVGGFKGIKHVINTNKIGYIRMYFDGNVISYDELPYLILLKSLLGNLATKNYSAKDLNTEISTYLGDLSFSNIISSKDKENAILKTKLEISSLDNNIDHISNLINEILTKTKFTKKEVKQKLTQLVNGSKRSIISNGMGAATTAVCSANSRSGQLHSKLDIDSPKVYEFLNGLLKNFDKNGVCTKLKDLSKRLFTKKNCFISLSGDEEIIEKMISEIKKVKIPTKTAKNSLLYPDYEKVNGALIIPSEVSYNAVGSNLDKLGIEYSGKLLVLSHIVTYDYLWSEVRVKGGAYGTSLRIIINNNIYLGSYRDPNVSNTYQVYENVANYLRKFKCSKDEFTTYIVGTLGNFDSPLSIPALINKWDFNYFIDFDKKKIVKLKKEILKTKSKDIQSYAELFDKLYEDCSVYTIGNESKIKEYNKFEKVSNL